MAYNCPKCRCGCLFEDHGKLVCMNCGAETVKAAAAKVPHVHHHKTYTGKSAGTAEEKPKIVRVKPAPSQTADLFSPRQKKTADKKKQGPLAKIAAVITILAMLSPLTELVEDIFDSTTFSTEAPAPEPEYREPGVLYWEVLGEVSEEEMDMLDEMISDYNEKYESPDIDSVVAFIEEQDMHDLSFRQWTIVQDGGNVRITFEK